VRVEDKLLRGIIFSDRESAAGQQRSNGGHPILPEVQTTVSWTSPKGCEGAPQVAKGMARLLEVVLVDLCGGGEAGA
jgi:hypothetical protein